jgi:hypothetical protein
MLWILILAAAALVFFYELGRTRTQILDLNRGRRVVFYIVVFVVLIVIAPMV